MFPGPARLVLAAVGEGEGNDPIDEPQQLQQEGVPPANLRRERLFRDRLNPLEVPDGHLLRYYRLPRHLILELCHLLTPHLEHPTHRSRSLSVMLQVLIGLRFLASGGFQSLIGDIAHVSQSTCSRVLKNFCAGLQALSQDFIKYPIADPNYIIGVKEEFFNIDHMPNVIGVIDCTHVLIMPPKDDKPNYVNRKGQTSLNVQMLCDAGLHILNVVVRWPGSTHDSFIWQNCSLKQVLDQHVCPGSYLLGDSGYPLEQYLLTPFRNPATPAEERYNAAHIKTRNAIERCFGVLKSRFRALHASGGVLMYTPDKVQTIITAACILHNICIDQGVPLEHGEVIPLEEQPAHQEILNHQPAGEQIRQQVVARFN